MENSGISLIAFLIVILNILQFGETNYITNPDAVLGKCGTSITLSTRTNNAVILKATNRGSYDGSGNNCTITIIPAFGHGVIAYIRRMNLRDSFGRCTDYVNIVYSQFSTPRMCSNNGDLYTSGTYDGNMNINLFLEYSPFSVYGRNFEIVLTQYDNAYCGSGYFKCNNGHCIKSGLECDERNNCGDNSDEDCVSVAGRVVGGIIGGLAIIAIAIGFACFMRRRRASHCTTTTRIINPNTVYLPTESHYNQHGTAYPPQVYSQGPPVEPQGGYQQGTVYPPPPPYSQGALPQKQ